MLSLNSYGLARRSNQNQGISLPRINVHGGHVREIQSLSKLEMMRKTPHPLYQTTSGYVLSNHSIESIDN
jgi:hypothetical protein